MSGGEWEGGKGMRGSRNNLLYSKEGKIKASFSKFKDQNKKGTNPITKVMCAAHQVRARDLSAVRVTGTAHTHAHRHAHAHRRTWGHRQGKRGKEKGGREGERDRKRKIMKEN